MAMSTDVNLPKHHKAQFPDQCVVCKAESPDSKVRLITGTTGWWSWLLWMFGKPFSVQAPACRRCSWQLHFQRFGSLLLTLALIYVAFWHVWPLLKIEVARPLQKWIMLGIALVCLLPQIFYEVVFPHPFSITAFSNSVDDEFRDEELAIEFANLNADADWVKIS